MPISSGWRMFWPNSVGATEPEHDHAVAERELGMHDRSILVLVDRVALKAEPLAEKPDRRLGVACSEAPERLSRAYLRRWNSWIAPRTAVPEVR